MHESTRAMSAHPSRPPLQPEEVLTEVRGLFESAHYHPPSLRAAAIELLSLAEDDEMEPTQAAEVVGRDPMLAAQFMRRAGSAAYVGRQATLTLRDAVIRLGIAGTRDLALEAAMSLSCSSEGPHTKLRQSLRRHSVAVAHLARATAVAVSASPAQSFLCGLFHDLGSLAIALALEELSREWVVEIGSASLWIELDALHPQQSAAVARLWGLPASVVDVLAHHHDLALAHAPLTVASTIVVGEALAEEFGLGFRVPGLAHPVESPDPQLLSRARRTLMLGDEPTPDLSKATRVALEAALGPLEG